MFVFSQKPEAPTSVNSGQLVARQKTPEELHCGNPGPVAPPPPRPAAGDTLRAEDPPSRPDSSSCPALPLTPLPPPRSAPSPQQQQQPPLVDVRMIDFAHSTFKGFRGDTAVHDGPDRGYVLGLESLIQILEGLQAESHQ